jgi:hypothetical protein
MSPVKALTYHFGFKGKLVANISSSVPIKKDEQALLYYDFNA